MHIDSQLKKRVVKIRGKALTCALGDDVPSIIEAVSRKTVNTTPIPFTLTEPDESRPYYLMPGTQIDAQDDPHGRFYGPLYKIVDKAIADAGLTNADLKDAGIFLGSTSMDIPIYETLYEESEVRDYFTQTASGFGTIAGNVARHFGICGPCHTFTTACTSSANGLLYATELIKQGDLDRAIVIGYDRFNKLGFYGFESLKLLSSTPYRPFDKNRGGIIMGEACGVVILDTTSQKDDDFRIIGGANACDTHNVALHNTDGNVVAKVMTDALTACGISITDVRAVKAHATGSFHNDLTESCAITTVFDSPPPPVAGLKPYVGHTVGASGAVELIMFTEAVRQGFIPATAGFETPDEELAISPTTENIPADKGIYMLNYFGFGGNCTTLIVANGA